MILPQVFPVILKNLSAGVVIRSNMVGTVYNNENFEFRARLMMFPFTETFSTCSEITEILLLMGAFDGY